MASAAQPPGTRSRVSSITKGNQAAVATATAVVNGCKPVAATTTTVPKEQILPVDQPKVVLQKTDSFDDNSGNDTGND